MSLLIADTNVFYSLRWTILMNRATSFTTLSTVTRFSSWFDVNYDLGW